MTTRLYYDDSYCTAFDATITAGGELDGRWAVQLDRTCFYPTSGGQPHDTGTIGDTAVIDVLVQGDALWHVLALDADAHRPAVGQTITGTLDWPRRYDHMQQHSGQHLLSQVCYRLFGFETVSVHFGPGESTLDLDAATVAPDQLAAAEQEANRLAYAALPIRAYIVDQAALDALPLRRPPKVTGAIRIVEIGGYDYSACGGTHVHTTAEIAPLKIVRQERRRGQTRLTFLCGQRAYQDYVEKHRLLAETAGIFSTDFLSVPTLVQRALDQARELQRQVDALTEQLVTYEVEDLLAEANLAQAADPEPSRAGGPRIVQKLYADRGVDALKQLAALLRSRPNTLALLATQAGGKLTVLFARSDDVNLHAGNLLRDTLKSFGGNGGGRPEQAQGGGIDPQAAPAILDHARRLAQQP
jgi:alanyl-tRNA synthetase